VRSGVSLLTFTRTLAGVVLVAIVGSSGCRSSSDDGPGSSPLALRLEAPDEARSGETIHLKLTIRNASTRTIDQPLGGQPPHDFVVGRADGEELWRSSKGQVIQDVLELKTLRPGQKLVFEADWSQHDNEGRPLPPGTYELWALLNTDPPERLETRAKRLVIKP
jgi:Intracellular proteinase inhibitor